MHKQNEIILNLLLMNHFKSEYFVAKEFCLELKGNEY